MSSELQPFDDEDEEQDTYKGSKGWVTVAVGWGGRAVFLDVDPGFGALRYHIQEGGLFDPEDSGLPMPDGGVYTATAQAQFHKDFDSGVLTTCHSN